MDVTSFRTHYPEFDAARFPDSAVNYWISIATKMLNPDRWGDDLLDIGLELFVAHHLVVEKVNQDTAKVGGWPGLNKGVMRSNNPGGVSISYDTNAVIEEKAGHWNYTVFGTRFVSLVKNVGAGPIQLGGGGTRATAWPGVILPWTS